MSTHGDHSYIWYTEGYISEVSATFGQPSRCKIIVDPTAPFKVESCDNRYSLLVHKGIFDHDLTNGIDMSSSTSQSSNPNNTGDQDENGLKVHDTKLVNSRCAYSVEGIFGCKIASTLIQLKSSRQKIRLEFDQEFKVVTITVI